jgi:hypothetical protein
MVSYEEATEEKTAPTLDSLREDGIEVKPKWVVGSFWVGGIGGGASRVRPVERHLEHSCPRLRGLATLEIGLVAMVWALRLTAVVF